MAVLAVLARDGSDPSTVYQHYRGEGSAFIQRALDDVVRVLAPTAGSSTIAEIVRSAMGRYDALEAAAIQETVGVVAVATTWAAEAAAEAMAENSTSSAVAPVTMPAATEQVPSAAVGSASGGRHDEPEGCGRSVVERAAAPGSGATCDDVARSAVVTQATTAIGAPAAVPDGAVTRPARHAALKVQVEEARQNAQQAQQQLWDCQASEQQCAVALEAACAEADYDDEDTKETLRPALGVVAASCCRLGWQHYGPAVWVGGWLGGCNWTPEWSVEGRALPHCLCCVCRSSPLGRDACRGDLPKGRPKKAAIAYRDAHAATAGATKRVAAARAELGQVQRLADTCASGPAAETKGLDAPATAAAPALPPRPTLPQVVPPSLSSVCPCWFGG